MDGSEALALRAIEDSVKFEGVLIVSIEISSENENWRKEDVSKPYFDAISTRAVDKYVRGPFTSLPFVNFDRKFENLNRLAVAIRIKKK